MPDQAYNFAGIADAPAPPAPGSERTRIDTNAVGVDHNKIVQGIADWASKLPPTLRRPAAMLATFPADSLASLLEMFSAPESVAGGGIKPALAAEPAVGKGMAAAGRGIENVGEILEKPARYVGAWEMLSHPLRGAATVAAPLIVKKAGQGLQSVGEAMIGNILTAADEAALAKAGVSAAAIERIKTAPAVQHVQDLAGRDLGTVPPPPVRPAGPWDANTAPAVREPRPPTTYYQDELIRQLGPRRYQELLKYRGRP